MQVRQDVEETTFRFFESSCKTKTERDALKTSLVSPESLKLREDGRLCFTSVAALNGGASQVVLDKEIEFPRASDMQCFAFESCASRNSVHIRGRPRAPNGVFILHCVVEYEI